MSESHAQWFAIIDDDEFTLIVDHDFFEILWDFEIFNVPNILYAAKWW